MVHHLFICKLRIILYTLSGYYSGAQIPRLLPLCDTWSQAPPSERCFSGQITSIPAYTRWSVVFQTRDSQIILLISCSCFFPRQIPWQYVYLTQFFLEKDSSTKYEITLQLKFLIGRLFCLQLSSFLRISQSQVDNSSSLLFRKITYSVPLCFNNDKQRSTALEQGTGWNTENKHFSLNLFKDIPFLGWISSCK